LVHIESELVGHGETSPEWRVRNALDAIREAYEAVGIEVDTPDTRRQHRDRAKKHFANSTDDREEAEALREQLVEAQEEIERLRAEFQKIEEAYVDEANSHSSDWAMVAGFAKGRADKALNRGGESMNPTRRAHPDSEHHDEARELRRIISEQREEIERLREIRDQTYEEIDRRLSVLKRQRNEMRSKVQQMRDAIRRVRSYNADIRDGKINYHPQDHIDVLDNALDGGGDDS